MVNWNRTLRFSTDAELLENKNFATLKADPQGNRAERRKAKKEGIMTNPYITDVAEVFATYMERESHNDSLLGANLLEQVARDLAICFTEHNPGFSTVKFLQNCGIEP